MKTLTAAECALDFGRILDTVEHSHEEIVITRDERPVAKLTPHVPCMTALEAMGDIYGLLSDEEGEAWLKDARGADALLSKELRDPWQ